MKKLVTILLALAVTFTFMPAIDGGEVQAAAKPAKVKITKAVKTNQMIDLAWKKAKRAKKYQIFMKKGKAKWKVVKTVNAKTLKFKKNGLAWNTKYAFKVRAINGKKKGAFSKTYDGCKEQLHSYDLGLYL